MPSDVIAYPFHARLLNCCARSASRLERLVLLVVLMYSYGGLCVDAAKSGAWFGVIARAPDRLTGARCGYSRKARKR